MIVYEIKLIITNQQMSKTQKQKSTHRQEISSSYSNYKCQYKQKPILTKLNNDSGYPQSILNPSEASSSRERNNYIEQNKKNLKNFFKERIPAENILLTKLMKREVQTIDPKRVFEIKQMEFQLKNKSRAKVSLQKQQMSSLQLSKQSNFQKVNANFHINDKNRQLKQKYGGKMNLSYYQEHNYRRGTQSHIGKRSKILKKQAYNKVFGPDISSLSRTEGFSKNLTQWATPPPQDRAKSISLTSSPQQTDEHHKTLRQLISKMNDYKNKLEDTDQGCPLPPQEDYSGVQYEQNLITMIRNMSKIYQGRNVSQGHKKVEKLEDLGKVYKQFYANLLSHKANRLNKRKQMIYETINISNQPSFIQHYESSPLQIESQSILSATDAMECHQQLLQEKQDETPRHSVKYRFKLLKKTLVRWAALFYIYGIKRQNIFLAFKSNRQPYQLEGSYAFFKCIKMGDLQSVKLFINRNPNFIFETEYYGKSPLSYACTNNQTIIAQFILEQGVNSDKLCNNNRTSLFYALQTRNVQLIKIILQKGASPWSTSQNPYQSMIKNGANASEISNLFNNAKKIYLGMQIQPTIQQRKKFWQQFNKKIDQNYRLTFGFYPSQ